MNAPLRLKYLSLMIPVAISYFVFGILGLWFAIPPGYASPIFPAAGVAVALMLWSGNRAWPGIWLGSFLLNSSVSFLNGQFGMTSLVLASVIAVGSTLQALLASRLVQWAVGNAWQELELEFDIIRSLVLAGFVSCIVSATTGVSVLYFFGVISSAAYLNSWWNWWVGDTLGVLVTMPLALTILYHKRPSWGKRLNTVALPMLMVLLAVAGIVAFVSDWEQGLKKEDIRVHGEAFKQLLQQRFIAHQEAVAALGRLVEVTPDMTYDQFEYFTRITLKDNPDIFALSFNPYVTRPQRAQFEMFMADIAPQYKIKQRDASSRLIEADDRNEYFPVAFIAPLQGNADAMGFDIGSEPIRHAAVMQAIKSGQIAVTAPLRLVQEKQDRVGILVLHPTYFNREKVMGTNGAGSIKGFATGVIKVDALIHLAAASAMGNEIVYQIDDVGAPAGRQAVFKSSFEAVSGNADYQWSTRMAIGDRIWLLKAFPTDAYLHRQTTPIAWIISVIGLFFTAILQVLMLVITGRTSLVEKKVQEQTYELYKKSNEMEDINAQLSALFSLSPDGFVGFSSDGTIQFINPTFQAITGIGSEDIIYKHEQALDAAFRKSAQSPEQFKGVAAYFTPVGTPPIQYELMLQHPRKTVLQIIGIHSDSPSLSRILYLRDITSETEVANLKTKFISHAAHELRTPMTSIYGYIELLRNRKYSEKIRQEMLEAMQRQASLIVNMVNELLDLARLDAQGGKDYNFAAVNMNALISKIISDLTLEEASWNIVLQLPQSPLIVDGNEQKIRQAIMNVLTNAQKYSASGQEIKLNLLSSEAHCGIEIIDHGIGMTEEQIKHVGERFWRADTSGSRPGTGLGMSIVKEIVKFHGGHIEIHSKPDQGTAITLWLPITH